MHTEDYTRTLPEVDPVKMIRAIHEAYLQLSAVTLHIDCAPFDNTAALESLSDCLKDAGHPGFQPETNHSTDKGTKV